VQTLSKHPAHRCRQHLQQGYEDRGDESRCVETRVLDDVDVSAEVGVAGRLASAEPHAELRPADVAPVLCQGGLPRVLQPLEDALGMGILDAPAAPAGSYERLGALLRCLVADPAVRLRALVVALLRTILVPLWSAQAGRHKAGGRCGGRRARSWRRGNVAAPEQLRHPLGQGGKVVAPARQRRGEHEGLAQDLPVVPRGHRSQAAQDDRAARLQVGVHRSRERLNVLGLAPAWRTRESSNHQDSRGLVDDEHVRPV